MHKADALQGDTCKKKPKTPLKTGVQAHTQQLDSRFSNSHDRAKVYCMDAFCPGKIVI